LTKSHLFQYARVVQELCFFNPNSN